MNVKVDREDESFCVGREEGRKRGRKRGKGRGRKERKGRREEEREGRKRRWIERMRAFV